MTFLVFVAVVFAYCLASPSMLACQRVLRGRPMVQDFHDYTPLPSQVDGGALPVPPGDDLPEITIAFYGDSGTNLQSRRVFRMAQRDADAVVHVGDFAYEFMGAQEFTETVEEIFGPQYPYITTIGDHDLHEADHYRNFFTRMNLRTPGLECEGSWGYASVCRYQGIVFLGMGLRFRAADYDRFLRQEMHKYRDWPWKICMWHRVATEFQPGWKTDTTGTYFYDRCRAYGAMIVTGHEHMYGRTHTLTSFREPGEAAVEAQKNPKGTDLVHVGNGRSFAVVSGNAGGRLRNWNPRRLKDPWWASVVGAENSNSHGCLFCTFRYRGDARRAFCEFREVSGIVYDRFEIQSLPNHQDTELVMTPPSPVEMPDRQLREPARAEVEEACAVPWITHVKAHDCFALLMGGMWAAWRHGVQYRLHSRYMPQVASSLDHSLDLILHRNVMTRSWPVFAKQEHVSRVWRQQEGMLADLNVALDFPQDLFELLGQKTTGHLLGVYLQITGTSNVAPSPTDGTIFLHSKLANSEEEEEDNKTAAATVEWRLSARKMYEGGTRAVWVSPDLKSMAEPCLGNFRDRECTIRWSSTSSTGYTVLHDAFASHSRIPPILHVEYVLSM